jgi:hypothetical protein
MGRLETGALEVTAHARIHQAPSLQPDRFAAVDYDLSYLRMPLNWRLRIWGQGVGGYAAAEGSVSRYADKARAETAAQVWIDTGTHPAFQAIDFAKLPRPYPPQDGGSF